MAKIFGFYKDCLKLGPKYRTDCGEDDFLERCIIGHYYNMENPNRDRHKEEGDGNEVT